MYLKPKKTKYKKTFRGKFKFNKIKNENLSFGSFGFCALSGGFLTSKQLEIMRQVITQKVKRTGKVWVKPFPVKGLTKKPNETRMGKGKGEVKNWISFISPGQIIYEIEGISLVNLNIIFKILSFKSPIKLKILQWFK